MSTQPTHHHHNAPVCPGTATAGQGTETYCDVHSEVHGVIFEMKEKTIAYDNYPDMKIKLEDGRIVTLGELEPMVMAAGKLFAYAPWSTSKNPRSTRILASISADGLALFDFKTRVSHRWASRKPMMPDLNGLAALLKHIGHRNSEPGSN